MPDDAVDYSYRYPFPSAVELAGGEGRLRLAAAQPGASPAAHFYRGRLRNPVEAAQLLLTLAKVAQSRFYTPPGMVQRLIREADPVVTAGGDRLRFEAFSLCCGLYARADLLPQGLAGEVTGRGTTNVDFNPPFRAALSQIRSGDRVALAVGREALELEREGATLEERKVKLPKRWLKGFVEAQSHGRGLALHHEIPGPEARRFLAGLAADVKAKDRCRLAQQGSQLRLSRRADPAALTVGGIGRLKLLAPLARLARGLKIYGSADSGVTAWVLELRGAAVAGSRPRLFRRRPSAASPGRRRRPRQPGPGTGPRSAGLASEAPAGAPGSRGRGDAGRHRNGPRQPRQPGPGRL
jgi:hypothetical protein